MSIATKVLVIDLYAVLKTPEDAVNQKELVLEFF